MTNLITDIWRSGRSLPGWVQIWVFVVLVPVNLAAVLFLNEPFGKAVAIMAIGGIAPNLILLFRERGFSKAMSIAHLIFWIPLILLLLGMVTGSLTISSAFVWYIWVLLIVDAVSIGFDIPDAWKWVQGDRAVAGK